MSAYSFLSAYGDVGRFPEGSKEKERLIASMKIMRDGVDPKEQESLHKQLGVMLNNTK